MPAVRAVSGSEKSRFSTVIAEEEDERSFVLPDLLQRSKKPSNVIVEINNNGRAALANAAEM